LLKRRTRRFRRRRKWRFNGEESLMASREVEWRLAGDEDQMAQKKGGVRIEGGGPQGSRRRWRIDPGIEDPMDEMKGQSGD
jgi:hypothetical protein